MQFISKYNSRFVIHSRRGFLRLATGLKQDFIFVIFVRIEKFGKVFMKRFSHTLPHSL